jgi:predicted metalloprotease
VSDGDATRLPRFPSPPATPSLPPLNQSQQFVAAVFTDAQNVWTQVFAQAGVTYPPARLVLFSSAVNTGCGAESSKVGPFYCPADHTVYLDTVFFDELQQRYGVGGGFAQAYVVAHELGHHIQTVTGVTGQVSALRQRFPAQSNALSVLTELQADCYAGVWAYSTYRRGLLKPGDLDDALTAAAVVGDDFIQKSATGTVQPELWTHGSSAQRQHWLSVGYESGKPASCNTFSR